MTTRNTGPCLVWSALAAVGLAAPLAHAQFEARPVPRPSLPGDQTLTDIGGFAADFADPVSLPVTSFASAVAVADLNADGRADIAVYTPEGTVDVYRSTPAGYLLIDAHPTGGIPFSPKLAAADVNADGRPDLIVTVGGDVELITLIQRPDGLFNRVDTGIPTGFYFPDFALGELDGDGSVDIVTTHPFGVYLNDGAGNFSPVGAAGFISGSTIFQPELVRGNADALDDVVVFGSNSIRRAVNLGGGVLSGFEIEPLGLGLLEPGVVDADRDGFTDLVIAVTSQPTVRSVDVRTGVGDGTYAAPVAQDVGFQPTAFAIGDLDRDGRDDLAVVGGIGGPDQLRVLRGDGRGGFSLVGSWDLPVGNHPTSGPATSELEIGDLNGDGWADIVIAATNDGVILVMSEGGN